MGVQGRAMTDEEVKQKIIDAMVEKGVWLTTEEINDNQDLPSATTIVDRLGSGWRWSHFPDFCTDIDTILEIIDLKEGGLTYQQIGEKLGMSRCHVFEKVKKWMVIKGLWEERSWKK